MPRMMIQLAPHQLSNPDLDIRYALPDLLTQRSGGVIQDDGYDYVGDDAMMVLFLQVSDVDKAAACIREVIENERVLENDLRSVAVVAVEEASATRVVYPENYTGTFAVS